jgi:aminoglycoside/choline kinase family phosphotransferase
VATATSIPTSTADLTVAWLNEVLEGSLDAVADVRVEALGEGVGILAEVVRLRLTYAEPGSDPARRPATLIAKCQSAHQENVFLAQAMGFYEREVNFYRLLAPSLDLGVPRCLHADMAPGGVPFVLLLEEITGPRTIDQVAGASLPDCEAVIDQAVRLHARFWDHPDLWALDWLPPMNNPLYKGAQALGEAKWPAFEARWRGRVPDDALAWVSAVTPRYPDLLDWWVDQGHATYAHTDFRADNFLFGGSAGDGAVTVLDWQLCTRHVGVWDVANFLGQSVTIEDRREWEEALLARYHAGLVAAGVTGYDAERCRRDYRYCLLQQAWAQVAVSDLDPGNDRGRALLDAMITRAFTAASDHTAGQMLDEL